MSGGSKGIDRREIVRFIISFRDEHQYPPTVTEMAEHFGVARSTLHTHLGVLVRDGVITVRPGASAESARTIAITPIGMKYITSPLERF